MNEEKWNELEKYLIDQYEVFEDPKWLRHPSEIEGYFKDDGHDYFDCGQGYYQDYASLIAHIDNKFYIVTLEAEIGSERMDRGDRMHFVEEITSVDYQEIDKPVRKNEYVTLTVSEHDVQKAIDVLTSQGIEVSL